MHNHHYVTRFAKGDLTELPHTSNLPTSHKATLNKERRALINNGILRNRIKLRNSQLLVDNKPHCTVQSGKLHRNVDSSNDSTPMLVDNTTPPASGSD